MLARRRIVDKDNTGKFCWRPTQHSLQIHHKSSLRIWLVRINSVTMLTATLAVVMLRELFCLELLSCTGSQLFWCLLTCDAKHRGNTANNWAYLLSNVAVCFCFFNAPTMNGLTVQRLTGIYDYNTNISDNEIFIFDILQVYLHTCIYIHLKHLVQQI